MDMDSAIIRKLMEHMNVNGKALILTLASSGMRIGEALQIDLDDINLEDNPPTIIIRGENTKSGDNRITFINKEAKQTLEEWLKVRDKYLKSSLNKNKGLVNKGIGNLKDENDSRLFPFSYDNVKEIWDNVLKKTGYDKVDKSTGRKQLRIHQLRKFFRSQLALGCPVDIVENLMGHEGYLTDAYRRYTNKQMGEYYLKYEHLLYISMPEDILKLKSEFTDELNNTKDALCHNRSQVEVLIAENRTLKERLSVMEDDSGKFEYISPPKTARTYFIAVKEYIEHHGIEFTTRELKNIKSKLPKGSRARTVEMDMDSAIIRKLMEHMNVNGKALILTLASSGMRIGEALQIDLDDINLEDNPPTIIIRGENTKSGDNRITFINKEAKQTLEEWLKVRDKYLKSSLNKNKGLVNKGIGNLKDENDSRLFPFSYDNVKEIWDNVLKKTGYDKVDKSTGRKQLRIHQLRKFFRSQLALGCPVDIVENLMGHEGYLTDAYRRYTNKQMGEYYLKYEHLLYISMPEDILKLKSEFTDELNNTKDALCHNRSQVEVLIAENRTLKERLSVMEDDSGKFEYILQCLISGKQPEKLKLVNGKLVFADE